MHGFEYKAIAMPSRETDGLSEGLSLYFEPISLFLRVSLRGPKTHLPSEFDAHLYLLAS